MIEFDTENNDNEQEIKTEKTTRKRGERSAKRASSRSTSLKRKKPGAPAEEAETTPPKTKKTTTRKRIKKTTTSARSKTSRAKPTLKRAKPAAPSRAKPTYNEDEYEIKSHPDGTQFKVKITDKTKQPARFVPRRKIYGDSGPGPAMVDLDSDENQLPNGETKELNLDSIIAQTRRSVTYLKRRLKVKPEVAVILGSGHSAVSDLVDSDSLPYAKIPGFSTPSVEGHEGLVSAGDVEGIPTIFSDGRLHYYETGSMEEVAHPIRTFIAMGVRRIILTTSAGALNSSYKAGDIMFVKDHINMMGNNPMFGMDVDVEPTPFVNLSSVYDEDVNTSSERVCRRFRIRRQTGVLAGVRGPVYETPAEQAWIRSAGADAVCMSVIPEALAAAHVGVPVTALALITNQPSSQSNGVELSHGMVLSNAQKHAANLKKLIKGIFQNF